MQNSKSTPDDGLTINVNASQIILTPFNCASIVNEIFKGLLHFKNQIPYPYKFMKNAVEKKRKAEDTVSSDKKLNLTLSNQFRVVSNALDLMENVMKGIRDEFSFDEKVREVFVVFGVTPLTPKEVFSIKIDSVKGHNNGNHLGQLAQHQPLILRKIFLSQTWMDNTDTSSSCTNVYVFIKKHSDNLNSNRKISNFTRTKPLTFKPCVKHVIINITSSNIDENCCENLRVFNENLSVFETTSTSKMDSNLFNGNDDGNDDCVWYQFKDCLKGFKDCFVGKRSVTELW